MTIHQLRYLKIKEKKITSGGNQKTSEERSLIECSKGKDDFILSVFTRKKKDGKMRTIFNLKYANKDVKYNNFKMEPLTDIFKIIQPNCRMTSADFDTFYSIPINIDHEKYFKFYWIQFLKYNDMPSDYSE